MYYDMENDETTMISEYDKQRRYEYDIPAYNDDGEANYTDDASDTSSVGYISDTPTTDNNVVSGSKYVIKRKNVQKVKPVDKMSLLVEEAYISE